MKNQIVTAGLVAALFGAGLWIGSWFGTTGMVIATVTLAGAVYAAYRWSGRAVLSMAGAVPATDARLLRICADLSHKTGIQATPYVIRVRGMNAFATLDRGRPVVAATEGLVQQLDDEQLRGVMAHEYAHLRNGDVRLATIVGAVAGVVGNAAAILSEDIGVALAAPFVAMLIQLGVSRAREYEADRTAAAIVGSGEGLAQALERLNRAPRSQLPSSVAHLCIVPQGILSTHPPTKERVRRLRS